MEKRELNSLDTEVLLRLLDYCKYLYEEEKERTSRIEKKINIFSLFLGGGVLVSLVLPLEKLQFLLNGNILTQPLRLFGAISYIVSLLAFLVSFLLIVSIYKVQKFETPSNPQTAVFKALRIETLNDFISNVIADYSIASTRNHEINDKKAKYYSRALVFFVLGVLLSVVSITVFNGSTLISGGK